MANAFAPISGDASFQLLCDALMMTQVEDNDLSILRRIWFDLCKIISVFIQCARMYCTLILLFDLLSLSS